MTRTFPLGFDSGQLSGEKQLFFAILMDAIGCLFGQIGDKSERPLLRAEARAWIAEADPLPGWPIVFETVCVVLGVEPSYLRRALLVGDVPLAPALDRLARPRKATGGPIDPVVILIMWQNGLSVPVISRRFGANQKAIARILRTAGAGRHIRRLRTAA